MKLLEEDEDQAKMICAIDYNLIWVVGSQLKDYKRRLDGHLEDTSVRNQEIEFLKEGSATVARENIE